MRTTNNEITPTAVSFDEWKDLGPMGPRPSVGDAIFDNAESDSEYAGNDRETPVRDYQAHYFVAGRDNPFLNPERSRDMRDIEAAWSLREHYLRVLARRDEDSLFLFNEFARVGDRVMREAAALAGREGNVGVTDAEARQRLADTGANAADSELLGDEIASRQGAGATAGTGAHYTVIAATAEEARIVRGMIDYALSICPPGTEIAGQKRLSSPSELPALDKFVEALNAVSPNRFGQIDEKGRKIVALFASRGLEDVAVNAVRGMHDSFNVAPSPSAALWRALIDAKEGHHRIRLNEKSEGRKSAAELREDNEKVVKDSDGVIVVWDGNRDDRDFVYRAMAQAARLGKLGKVLDAEGKELPLYEISDQALKDVPSARQFARRRNAGVFDLPASSAEGRLGLSLVRGQRSGAMNTHALDALGNTGKTITELSEMAATKEGAKELFNQFRIPPATISALGDEQAMSNARSAYERIKQHCDEAGVTVVGPENYPMALLTSNGNIPPVLFVKGGDIETFRDLTSSIAVMGDKEHVPVMAQKASELVTELDAPGVTLVQVEDMGVPRFTPENGGILVLANGHSQYGVNGVVDWTQENESTLRGQGRSGAEFTIEAVPADGKARLTAKSRNGTESLYEVDWEGATLSTLVETPFDEPTEEDRAKALEAEARLDSLKSWAVSQDTKLLQAPIKEFRESFVEKGGMVISSMPPRETSSVYNADIGDRVGIPATRNDVTERQAVRLAASMSEMTAIVNAGRNGPMVHAIATLADAGRRPLVVEPAPSLDGEDARVAGNRALLSAGTAAIEQTLRVPGGSMEKIHKAFGPMQRPGISTGPDIKRAAAAIRENLLQTGDQPLAQEADARKTAEAVR